MTVTAEKPKLLEDAAALLRVLAAVEHAHLVGDDEAVITLLGQVDPLTCRRVAEELEASPPPRNIPPQGTGATLHPLGELAPVLPLDPWSRRV